MKNNVLGSTCKVNKKYIKYFKFNYLIKYKKFRNLTMIKRDYFSIDFCCKR